MKSINYERLIDYHNNNNKRKLQDLFPFHSTVAGLNDVFVARDDGKFHINSACILTDERTITKDDIYYLAYLRKAENDDSCLVKILDAFYLSSSIYVLVENILFGHRFIINHRIVNSEQDCQWLLVNIHNIDKNLNKLKNLVDNYSIDSELLEFDF